MKMKTDASILTLLLGTITRRYDCSRTAPLPQKMEKATHNVWDRTWKFQRVAGEEVWWQRLYAGGVCKTKAPRVCGAAMALPIKPLYRWP